MTSPLAKKLAGDLVQLGSLLGFNATQEEPVIDGSLFRIDAFWELQMPEGSPFPGINIASIEIQYSSSPASVSHNIFKAERTKHPAMHFILSYHRLTDDYINNVLKTNYPIAGLFLKHGPEEINEFHLWVNNFLLRDDLKGMMIERSEVFKAGFIEKILGIPEEKYEEEILPKVVDYLSPLQPPKEISTLVNKLIFTSKDRYDRSIFDDVFWEFIWFVQEGMKSRNITRIQISSYHLISDIKFEPNYAGKDIVLDNYIDIEQENLFIRDNNDIPLNIDIQNGNVIVSNHEIVCQQSLTYEDFIYFLVESSKEVLREFEKYQVSPENIEILKKTINELTKDSQ